jgi:hypothetical protein
MSLARPIALAVLALLAGPTHAGEIRGRVVDGAGRPVEHAAVLLTYQSPDRRASHESKTWDPWSDVPAQVLAAATSSADGAFALSGFDCPTLGAAGELRLTAAHAELGVASRPLAALRAAGRGHALEIALDASPTRLAILGPDGSPASGVRVTATRIGDAWSHRPLHDAAPPEIAATYAPVSDAAGEVVVRFPQGTPLRLVAPALAPQVHVLRYSADEEIRLAPTTSQRVTLLAPPGRDADGFTLVMTGQPHESGPYPDVQRHAVGGDGSVEIRRPVGYVSFAVIPPAGCDLRPGLDVEWGGMCASFGLGQPPPPPVPDPVEIVLNAGHPAAGVLLDPNGRPLNLAGVRLRLVATSRQPDYGGATCVEEVATDREGRFFFHALPGAVEAFVLAAPPAVLRDAPALRRRYDGYARFSGSWEPGPEPRIDYHVDVRLEPAGALAGWIVDAAGRPASGAWIGLEATARERVDPTGTGGEELLEPMRYETLADADGRFLLAGVRTAGPFMLGVEARGGAVTREFDALPKGPLELRLRRDALRAARVRAVDHAGVPIAGARLLVAEQERGEKALEVPSDERSTDADGRAETGPIALAGDVALVRLEGNFIRPEEAWVVFGAEDVELELRVARLRTARGRVVDAAGNPIAGAVVAHRGLTPERFTARSDAAGRFTLDGVDEGLPLVVVERDGFEIGGAILDLAGESEVRLRRPGRLEEPATPGGADGRRALAVRLLDAELDALSSGDGERFARWARPAIDALVRLDLLRAAELLDGLAAAPPMADAQLRRTIAEALAARDPDGWASALGSRQDPRWSAVVAFLAPERVDPDPGAALAWSDDIADLPVRLEYLTACMQSARRARNHALAWACATRGTRIAERILAAPRGRDLIASFQRELALVDPEAPLADRSTLSCSHKPAQQTTVEALRAKLAAVEDDRFDFTSANVLAQLASELRSTDQTLARDALDAAIGHLLRTSRRGGYPSSIARILGDVESVAPERRLELVWQAIARRQGREHEDGGLAYMLAPYAPDLAAALAEPHLDTLLGPRGLRYGNDLDYVRALALLDPARMEGLLERIPAAEERTIATFAVVAALLAVDAPRPPVNAPRATSGPTIFGN